MPLIVLLEVISKLEDYDNDAFVADGFWGFAIAVSSLLDFEYSDLADAAMLLKKRLANDYVSYHARHVEDDTPAEHAKHEER